MIYDTDSSGYLNKIINTDLEDSDPSILNKIFNFMGFRGNSNGDMCEEPALISNEEIERLREDNEDSLLGRCMGMLDNYGERGLMSNPDPSTCSNNFSPFISEVIPPE